MGEETTFCDYFVVCGLDTSSGLEIEKYAESIQGTESRPPLEKSYIAKILGVYPDHRSDSPFSQEILSLCMPAGLRFCTQKDLPPTPDFHTFANIKADGMRVDGSVLTFYERVEDPHLCDAMQTLHTMHVRELTGAGGGHIPGGPIENGYHPPGTVSGALERLMLVAESMVSLAFPFRWQHVYVPILPYSQALFLEAPLPFVMGLAYQDHIPQEVYQSTLCILDIDSGRVQLPEDLPAFPDRSELMQELALVFDRFRSLSASANQYSNGGDGVAWRDKGPDQRTTEFSQFRRNKTMEWNLKRMSRSFDEDAAGLLDNNNSLPPNNGSNLPSREQLPRLHLDMSILEESDPLARVTAIARRAGVTPPTMDSLQKELESSDFYRNSPACREYFMDMKYNNAVREIFLNRFTYLLYSYEHFVIGGNCGDRETFVSNRDSMQNFDKAAFLSDLPESHLNFMAAFIETQMFTSFVDWKILSQWDEPDPNLLIFDRRLQEIRDKFGQAMVRTPTYESCPSFALTEEMISKREEKLDYDVPPPHLLPHSTPDYIHEHQSGVFPPLNQALLCKVPQNQESPWRKRRPHRTQVDNKTKEEKQQEEAAKKPVQWLQKLVKQSEHAAKEGIRPPSFIENGVKGPGLDLTPAQIAQTNWKFVDQLLRETKAKTKRLLVEKMGAEAISLGHTDLAVTGVEENTLVASLCDLLERIWAHGVHKKQGKSAFWTHLLAHQELEKGDTKHALHPGALLTPEEPTAHPVVTYLQNLQKEMPESGTWSSSLIRAASFICDKIGRDPNLAFPPPSSPQDDPQGDLSPSGWNSPATTPVSDSAPLPPESPRKRSYSRPRSPDLRNTLRALPNHISSDLKNVLRMTEIKTEIGYARAFVRLSLERKNLHKHLKTLLNRQDLLRSMYKRYAFLRCEEEKEQFLYHLLSLNAADFRCFTNTFTRTKMQYQAMLVPGGGRFTLSNTAANLWIRLAGTLGETAIINLPKNTLQFTFEHKNLGVLSTLRIGHSSTETVGGVGGSGAAPPPKWFLEFVVVRNELTGHTYKFPCSRWFGRGVEDGSLERLLVAEVVRTCETEPEVSSSSSAVSGASNSRCRTPTRSRSPSVTRRGRISDNPKLRILESQHELGESVNNIVKHFYRHPEKEQRSRLTRLLCGERGLVMGLERAFLIGFRSSRFFKQLYPWDYIEKVTSWFFELLKSGSGQLHPDQRELITHMCNLVSKIGSNSSIGKEERFQTFVLLAIKDHVLSGLLPLMAWTPVTGSLYDEPSFLRTPKYLTFLTQLLHSLNEFTFDLEHSLTWAVHS